MHAVRTQCEVLDVGKYSNPSLSPFSQVFGSVPRFFWLPKHLGCGIFELSTIFAHFQPFPPTSSPAWVLAQGVRAREGGLFWAFNLPVALGKPGQLSNPHFVVWPLELGLGT